MFGMGSGHTMKEVPDRHRREGGNAESSTAWATCPSRPTSYWGAQTQRSLHHFSIGNDRMPKEVYHAYGTVKKACALVNQAEGRLPEWKADAIVQGRRRDHRGPPGRPLPAVYVWQTGSGTQSNMNVNEVLSNRAIQLLGGDARQPAAGRAPTTT